MKNHIKTLRSDFGLTQAGLAKALGVSRQTINAIEKGKFDPSLPLAFKISNFFGTGIENIFENEEKEQPEKAG
jgi:putative transcriptional regulator